MPADLLLRERLPCSDGATRDSAQVATLTPYLLDGVPRPAFVVCPGGNMLERAAHEGAPIAAWLNRIGFHAFVLNYRLLPHPPTAALADGARAVRYLRHHAGPLRVDPERIGMIGFSGGGFLTAFVGTRFENTEGESPEDQAVGHALFPRDPADPIDRESAQVNVMVLAYATVRLTPERMDGALTGVAIPIPEHMSRERAAQYFSSDAHVSARTPPTFLWVTATDNLGLCPDTLAFAQALRRRGVPFELHVFSRGGHGLGLAADEPAAATWTDLCQRWLRDRWG